MQKGRGIYLPLPAALVPPLLGELVGPSLLSNYVEYRRLPLPWSLAFFLHFPLQSHLKRGRHEKRERKCEQVQKCNLISKLIKRGGSSELPVLLSPNSSPSGSSSFRCPTISSNCAHLAAIKTSYLI